MSPKRTVEIIPVSEPEHRDGIVGSEAESEAGSGPELGRDRRIVPTPGCRAAPTMPRLSSASCRSAAKTTRPSTVNIFRPGPASWPRGSC
jgi:hypothetical protein